MPLAEAVAAADFADRADPLRSARSRAAIVALADLSHALHGHGLRSGACSGDEMRLAAHKLHAALATLGVGTPAGKPKPDADDLEALVADWHGPHVRPRRLSEYPLYGVTLAAGHLSVLSPRGVGWLHATFLCEPCRAAESAGTFVAGCYIHVLLDMLSGVRCAWGPAGPPAITEPAPRPTRPVQTAELDAWLDAEHDRMVSAGKAETLSAAQATDPLVCSMIATCRVALRLKSASAAPARPGLAGLTETALAAGASRAAGVRSAAGPAPLASAQLRAFDERLAALAGDAKPRFVMGLLRTVNKLTTPKSLRYSTVHDAVVGAPPGVAMRGSDGEASFYQLPLHADDRRYFCYVLPSGRIGRKLRSCFGGNAAPSAEAFLTAEIKSVLRGGYPSLSLRGEGSRCRPICRRQTWVGARCPARQRSSLYTRPDRPP